jgi:hypothetical protein
VTLRAWFHERWRRRVSLLAEDALPDGEREATLRHLSLCPGCRGELQELRDLLQELAADPVHQAEPPLPVEMLAARVEAQVLERLPGAQAQRASWLMPVPVAVAAVLAVAILVPSLVRSLRGPAAPATLLPEADHVPAAASLELSDEALLRLEHRVAREQTARYLGDAGDVLVSVASLRGPCARRAEQLDVSEAQARSRSLLARRALVVQQERVASAVPVLDDVEQALRGVASLEACARRQDLERLQEDVERRRLLMRIRLLRRELEG